MSKRGAAFIAVTVAVVLLVLWAANAPSQEPADATSDWAVQPGFSLAVDTQGYEIPTAIAFVPNPSSEPDDPLYFVTELRGQVKVVTNDRSVSSFAMVSAFQTEAQLPAGTAQAGLAGICLDPENGHVFVTYTYEDNGILRNDISRFETTPGSFSLAPTSEEVRFTEVFAPYQAAPAHQIGGCQVEDGRLFASIGDGGNPAAAGDVDQLLGKVVCLTVDGAPCPDNPFLEEAEPGEGASFVWAYGFRNPFGLKLMDDEVFVAENGLDIDRFVRIERGRNYHWNGSDKSIATGADLILVPTHSPVQLDHYPRGSAIFPEEYRDDFFVAAAGRSFGGLAGEEATAGVVGVVSFSWDPGRKEVTSVPSEFVRHRGEPGQAVVGLAFGPDGLYFVPILPGRTGQSSVFRVSHDPGNEHPFVIGEAGVVPEAGSLLAEKGCLSCHQLGGQGGTIGPSLDSFTLLWRLRPRLSSEEYEQQVARVDQLEEEPFVSFRDERREILEADQDERLELWIKSKLLEPKFDNPQAQMPNLGLTEQEAQAITDFLVTPGGGDRSLIDRVLARKRPVGAGLVAGVVLSLFVFGLWRFVARPLWARRSGP